MVANRKADQSRILWLAEEDVVAARRLLTLLGESDSSPESQARRPEKAIDSASRRQQLDRASLSLAMRQRRVGILGESFSSEPPFEMLLAVYVNEDRERDMTVTKLAELALLKPTTSLRCLEQLISEGWLTRTTVAADRRKGHVKLTDKARQALDELFSWPE